MARSRRPVLVQSVSRSLDLLEALALPGDLGLVELAQAAELQPSTAHRLLSTLVERGYVLHSAQTGRYLLGHKLLELASFVNVRTAHLCALARPHLVAVQKATGESSNLTVLDLPNVVYVDQVEGTRSVRMFTEVGRSVAAHTTGSGKAPGPGGGGRGLRGRAVRESDAAHADDARCARRGTLADPAPRLRIDNEEHEEGVSCVAAPVFDNEGAARAAISVSAPTSRIHGMGVAELGELLTGRASAISAALGFDLPVPLAAAE